MLLETKLNPSEHYAPKVLANVSCSKRESKPVRKWNYLLSDTLRFSDSQTNGIRIQKPAQDQVFDYCVKIVSHQQLDTLYIEEHTFTTSELFNLTMLCKNKRVNLIHLTKRPATCTDNVVYGPW